MKNESNIITNSEENHTAVSFKLLGKHLLLRMEPLSYPPLQTLKHTNAADGSATLHWNSYLIAV